MLSALAAHTERLRLGLLVTSNRIRPPALLAKIAATVDVVSGGRLDFGIGVGSRPDHPLARREYQAHGLPFHETDEAVASLAQACTVIRRLWTEDEPFDFHGDRLDLVGAFCNPKPVQRPHPPIVSGGRSMATLRVVAQHADVWNIPGGDTSTTSSAAARYSTASAPRSVVTRLDHPLDRPARLLRRATHHPGRRGRNHRGRLPARRADRALALPHPRPAVGHRRDHHPVLGRPGPPRLTSARGPATRAPWTGPACHRQPGPGRRRSALVLRYRPCLQPPELFAVSCHCCTICDSEAAISVSRSLVAC